MKSPEEQLKELQAAIHESALKGNSQAQRLEAQLIGLLAEKQKGESRLEFSAAQYVELTNKLITGLRESYKQCGGVCPICGQFNLTPTETGG